MSKSKRKNTSFKYWHEVVTTLRGYRDFRAERIKNHRKLAALKRKD